MSKKIEKLFKSYRDQLIHLAKLYGVVEIKSYARSAKRLTISQLELLLIKNFEREYEFDVFFFTIRKIEKYISS